MRILVVANCQGSAMQALLAADGRHLVDCEVIHTLEPGKITDAGLRQYDLVIAQDIRPDLRDFWGVIARHPNVIHFPWLLFFGFQPDHRSVQPKVPGKGGGLDNMPRIMVGAHRRGLSPEETATLYNPVFLDLMGYTSDFSAHRSTFIQGLAKYTPLADYLFEKWYQRDVFFFTGNHPRSFVIEDILRELVQPVGLRIPEGLADLLPDPLQTYIQLPSLNHPRARNLLSNPAHFYVRGGQLLNLDAMIAWTFRKLGDKADSLAFSDLEQSRFDAAYARWLDRPESQARNPYAGRPAHTYWAKSVVKAQPADVRPGAGLTPVITPETRVATAGSCFAQHVARAMVSDGLNYYVAERAPEDLPEETAGAQGYGLFSARFGNIYSTRQLLQLFQRAYGTFTPIERAWSVPGGFVDPFRPNIGETFPSAEAVAASRDAHLARVREMFETLDVFVFTLGLTEGWIDRRDGAAFPVTPGAITRQVNPENYAFVNAGYQEIRSDLVAFFDALKGVNPRARVILTVSPVPLIATYTDDDALTATTYSKSVLRAVAGDVAKAFGFVQYFPSYEIITGAFNRGAYFAEDLRSVRPEGVAHVMDVFRETLVRRDASAQPETRTEDPLPPVAGFAEERTQQMFIVCDEELLVVDRDR